MDRRPLWTGRRDLRNAAVREGSVRVLMTGGAGFIGSHLCDRLIAEGHSVIVLDNLVTGNSANLAHLAGREEFSFVRYDVSNFIFVPGPVDAVLHLASPASPNPAS